MTRKIETQNTYCQICDEITEQWKLPKSHQTNLWRVSYFCNGCCQIWNYLRIGSKVFESVN